MITLETRKEIYQSAAAQMREWYGPDMAEQGACLYWTRVTMRELSRRGLRPVLQAGTMLWRVIPAARDDGHTATHFGYEWTPNDPFSREAVARGQLPEVHIWVALPDEECLIDFSTQYFPKLAKERHGIDWLTEPPPQFIFGAPPADAFYRPNTAAIKFVWRFILERMASPEQLEQLRSVLA